MSKMSEIIGHFDLAKHPEGGYYKENYRSSESIPVAVSDGRFAGDRSCCSAIYYLLAEKQKSYMHRLRTDEIWHHYDGQLLCIVEITPAGQLKQTKLGATFQDGSVPQYVVKAGHWFGAYLPDGVEYSFVGCTAAPGFDFADFEMAQYDTMISRFPEHAAVLDLLVKR